MMFRITMVTTLWCLCGLLGHGLCTGIKGPDYNTNTAIKRDKPSHLDAMQVDPGHVPDSEVHSADNTGENHVKSGGTDQGEGEDNRNSGTGQLKHLDSMQVDPGRPSDRHKRTVVLDESRRWTKFKIPYVITDSVPEEYRADIFRSMKTYERFTCLRYVAWVNESGVTTNQKLGLGYEGYLKFVKDDGACRAPLGNRRDIYLVNCCLGKTCMHELGHAMGMTHEAPSPDRDGWMRVNYENISPDGVYFYTPYLKGEALSYGYDYSSVMHYATWGFSSGGPTFNFLFPELKTQRNYYYVTRDVSLSHKCQENVCLNFSLTCENDGYATLVDGECDCMCVHGLDPSKGCSDAMKTDPPSVVFPGGDFALPQPAAGCPDNMQVGSRTHYSQGSNAMSKVYSLKGTVSDKKAEHHFCVSTAASSGRQWPSGSYCIYRRGRACPEGFKGGYVQYDDAPTTDKPNSQSGQLPDGVFNDKTRLEFCCRDDGFSSDEIFLPSRQPLALFKFPGQDCQPIRGMHVTENRFTIGRQGPGNGAKVEGATPVIQEASQLHTDVCYYQPAMIDCGGVIELSRQNRVANFSSPQGSHLDCVWLVKAPEGDGIVLNFPVFNIKGQADNCEDKLEIRHARPGQPGDIVCGSSRQQSTRSILNYMYVRFSTFGNTDSRFEATASLVSDDEHCYFMGDRGMSYDGGVNFTRNMEPCLRWDEVTHCEHHAYSNKDQEVRLVENYCRTPSYVDGFRPWCYTNSVGCERNYCDVCLLENVYDTYDKCAHLAEEGICSDLYRARKYCAKTCQISPGRKPPKAADVICQPPPEVANTVITFNPKTEYNVGDKVTYKCIHSQDTQNITCTTSGIWSPRGPVCSECGNGWEKYGDSCYKYFSDDVVHSVARETCKSHGGHIATLKTREEQDFVLDLIKKSGSSSSEIWIGMTDEETEGVWKWADGTPLSGWTNWEAGAPNNWNNAQDCAVLTSIMEWNDISCQDTYKYVCQKGKIELSTVCGDFLDTCVERFEKRPDMCTKFLKFSTTYCPFTCGFCDLGSSCTVPPPPEHAETSGSVTSLATGGVVSYTCKTGYVLVAGNQDRGCLRTGQLSGQPPVCVDQSTQRTVINNQQFFAGGSIGYWGTSYTAANDNFRITRDGEVTRWEYLSNQEGQVAFQVWRHHPEKGPFEFEFVGQNILQNTRVDIQWFLDVPESQRIKVKAGDYIGIYYGYYSRGGVLFMKCSNKPAAENVVWRDSIYDPTSLVSGTVISFDPSASCRDFNFRAIVGPSETAR